MWLDLLHQWADSMNPRPKEITGQWGVIYNVSSVYSVDGHLRDLHRMMRQVCERDSNEQTLPAIRRIRREQDILLDARLEAMK